MSDIRVYGIVATINNSLFALQHAGQSFIPHGKKSLALMDAPKTIKLKGKVQSFADFDKSFFWGYVREIKDNSVILIGGNTFKDAFFVFNKLLSDKTITFIVSDPNKVEIVEAKAGNWDAIQTIGSHEFHKDESKSDKLEITKNLALQKTHFISYQQLSTANLYVMGGKSIYEMMHDEYNEFINVNLQLPQSNFKEFMRLHDGMSYVLTSVVSDMINNNFFSKELLEKHGDISVLLSTNNQRNNSV